MTRTILCAALLLALAAPATAAPRFSCAQVRWAVKTFGKRTLEVMGKTYGVTKEEMDFAKECLRKG